MKLTIGEAGGVTRGQVMAAHEWWMALGEGAPDWGETPPVVEAKANELVAPVGFVRARERAFVLEDADGEIVSEGGVRWTHSGAPTRYLYVKFVIDFPEAQPTSLRELAVYLDAEPKREVPPGQNYVAIGDMKALGHIYGMDRFSPVIRDGSQRQVYTTIMKF